MSLRLIGKKRGMTQFFDEAGKIVACTVIELEPNVVISLKTEATDGYNAVILGAVGVKANKLTKPERGVFQKKQLDPKRFLKESRVGNPQEFQVGQEIGADYFADIKFVDITGRSKGKGYQGAMKRHGAHGMNASHGAGPVHRHVGSIGWVRGHGRTPKNKIMAGHMGDEVVTTQNIRVRKIQGNALIVEGAVPGASGRIVFLRKAVKKYSPGAQGG